MISLSCHILDTATGLPAAGIAVTLTRLTDGQPLATACTNDDGRIATSDWGDIALASGDYQLRFHIVDYQQTTHGTSFYPWVDVCVSLAAGHYHIPLLLSPFGYSTYRGS